MGTSCVTYTCRSELPCSGNLPSDVILCVPSSKVAVHTCPAGADSGDQVFTYTFIEATLTAVSATLGDCSLNFKHTICFDDSVLLEGQTLLDSDLTGVFCEGCFSDWVKEFAGEEVSLTNNGNGSYTLITQHGCEYTFSTGSSSGITVSDTSSIDLTLAGSVLSGTVKISPVVGNSITQNPDGIFAPTPTGVTVSSTSTLTLVKSGINISGSVKISPDAGNEIVANSNGIYAPALSVLDTNSVNLTLSSNTLSADSKISADAGNQISIHSDGLFVPATTVTVSDTSSVDMTLSGSDIHSVVKLSPDADNCLEIRSNGLYVPCGGGGGGGGSPSAIWVQEGGDKVTQDELRMTLGAGVTSSVWDGVNITLFGAQNEVVNFNIVVEAGTSLVSNVTVEFSLLDDGVGDTISSIPATGNGVFNYVNRSIELFVLKYLPIQGLTLSDYDNSYDERHVPIKLQRLFTGSGVAVPGTGWVNRPNHDKLYPEIAVPAEVFGTVNIALNTNQQFWCDIYIPTASPPGVYNGSVVVKVGGVTFATIPINLTVRNFALPDISTCRVSAFLGSSEFTSRFLGVPFPLNAGQDATLLPIRREFFKMAHRHKLALWNDDGNAIHTGPAVGQPNAYWTEFLDGTAFAAPNGYDGPGISTPNWLYVIGAYGTWNWAETQPAFRTASDAWYTFMNGTYPSIFTFVYISDESPDFARTELLASWIKTNPGVGQNLLAMATVQWPQGQTDTPSLDICAANFNWGVTTTWDSAHTFWTTGKEAWLYNGQRELQGSFATEDEGVSPRLNMWCCYKKGVDSFFFWDTDYWNHASDSHINTHLWTDAQTFGYYTSNSLILGRTGFLYDNGEGVLFYPGTDVTYPAESFGIAGPLASLRLKYWRRGVQDVDYINLAAAVDAGATNAVVSGAIPLALWEYDVFDPLDPSYNITDISWSVDPDDWEAARLTLADIIEGSSPTTGTSVFVGSFAINTSTGNQAITGVGFLPKAVMFIGCNVNGNGNLANATHFFGAATSATKRWVCASDFADAVTTSTASNYFSSAKCITSFSTGTTISYAADFVSMDSDGFTINVTTAPGATKTIYYAAFGGASVNAKADIFDAAAATGAQAFSGVGFTPELVMFSNTISNTTEGSIAGSRFGIGAALDSTHRWLNAFSGTTGSTPQLAARDQFTNKCFGRFVPGGTAVLADFVSMDADGFTLNFTTAGNAPRSGYFALTADHERIGKFSQNTTTGAQSITLLGFAPKFIMLISWGNITAVQQPNARRSIGFGTAPTEQGCISIGASDTTSPSSCSSRSRNDKIISMIVEGGTTPTVLAEASLTSLDADGFTITWSTADATAREILYLAIG